jgi:phospholipid/cholesterol/gamma-HCH transport system substrate-binding protein
MKRRDEVLVGLLVTVAVVVAVVGTIWLVRGSLAGGYPLYAQFPWGAGLKNGQPVRLAGVQVGFVSDVRLRDDGFLDVEMRIEEGRDIPDNSTAKVAAVGFFGDAEIQLWPARPGHTTKFAEGDTVPLGAADFSINQALARIDTVSRALADITTAVEVKLVDEGGLADVRRTIANTNHLIGQLAAIADEQSRELILTQQTLRRSLRALDSASVDSTVRNLQATSANMTALTANLKETTTQLNSVLGRLDRGEGTAGKLLRDEALYGDLRRLVTRVDSLTLDFKQNPRRYINLEIF